MYRLWSSTGYFARVVKLTGVNLATIATASAIHTIVTQDYVKLFETWNTPDERKKAGEMQDESQLKRRP